MKEDEGRTLMEGERKVCEGIDMRAGRKERRKEDGWRENRRKIKE
jgi:hypothetical protein